MRKSKTYCMLLWVLLSGWCTGCTTLESGTTGTQTSTSSQADNTFLLAAISSGKMEVRASEIALEKAANLEVREFAKLVMRQHTNANGELTTIASQNRVALPNTMDANHKAIVDQLAKLNAPEFDVAYVQQMEQAHTQDIALYQALVKSSQSVTLRAFALKTIPLLQGHQKLAAQLKKIRP